jgi:tight adherence protein B
MLDAEMMELLTIACAALAITAVVAVLVYPLLVKDASGQRIKTVTDSGARSKKLAARNAADVTEKRKKTIADSLKELDNRKKKTNEKVSLRARLQQAGLDVDTRTYWIASAVAGVVIAIGTFFMLPSTLAGIAPGLAAVAGFGGALGLPGWVLNFLITRRQTKFLANLANAIDVVVRGVKTGLPLNECLGIIARESPEPVCSEIREVVDQQRMGVTLGDALDRLVVRVPLPEVKFLAIVISIQQSAGGNLSEALGNLSQVLRDRFGLKMKVKALSAEALASAMVLGSLPPIVILLVHLSTPDYLTPLWETKTGQMLAIFGGFWMMCGIWIMRKMINFKY